MGNAVLQLRTVLTSHAQRAHRPYQSLGNYEEEDERFIRETVNTLRKRQTDDENIVRFPLPLP
jgi:hypothetical protein